MFSSSQSNETGIISIYRRYIESVLNHVTDMKVLLMDNETLQILGLIFTQTELLLHDVVFTETIQQLSTKTSNGQVDPIFKTLPCICLIRPVMQNIKFLCLELNQPHFQEYYLYFTNSVPEGNSLTQLAQSDKFSKVNLVNEIFLDTYIYNSCLFSLDVFSSRDSRNRQLWNSQSLIRSTEGLFSLCASLRTQPLVRYDGSSPLARSLAQELCKKIDQNASLLQPQTHNSTPQNWQILILDRRSDPISPLLHFWTYTSLLNEIFGIHNNVVDLSCDGNPNLKNQIVLDARSDRFYSSNLFSEYDRLADAVRKLVSEVKAQNDQLNGTEWTPEQLSHLIRDLQINQEKKAVVSKHVELTSAINTEVKNQDLITVSKLEQQIATENDPKAHYKAVLSAIQSAKTTDQNAFRLCILLAIRYNRENLDFSALKSELCARPNGDKMGSIIDDVVDYANGSFVAGDRRVLSGIISSAIKITESKSAFALWTPWISGILEKLDKGKLLETAFPSANIAKVNNNNLRVIVFVIGGVTYEEERIALQYSKGKRTEDSKISEILLGGTQLLNMKSFINQEVLGLPQSY